MVGKTYYQSDRALDLILGQTVVGASTTYVGLFTTNPNGDGDLGSLQGGTWEESTLDRVLVSDDGTTQPYWSGKSSESNKRIVSNVGTISWTTASSYVSETIVGVGIWDHISAGNLLYWEPLDSSRVVVANQELAFTTGNFKVRED